MTKYLDAILGALVGVALTPLFQGTEWVAWVLIPLTAGLGRVCRIIYDRTTPMGKARRLRKQRDEAAAVAQPALPRVAVHLEDVNGAKITNTTGRGFDIGLSAKRISDLEADGNDFA